MSKSHKGTGVPDTKQINFFTDEAVENDSALSNTSDDSAEKSLSHGKESHFEPDVSATVHMGTESTDTEIIESEILPEEAVEATTLTDTESDTDVSDSETEAEETEERPQKPPKTPRRFRRESVLIHFLILVVDAVSRTLRNSFLASILTAYDKTSDAFRASFLYHLFAEKPALLFKTCKKKIRRMTTDSVIPKKLNKLTSSLLQVKIRIYGLILLAFAFSALFVHFFVNLYFSVAVFSIYTPFIASGIIIASLFLVFTGKTLAEAFSGSRIFSAFGFKLLGLSKNPVNDSAPIELSGSGAVVFGLLLGFLTIVFPIHAILLFTLSVIYTVIVIKNPESGLISLFLLAPFASLTVLAGAIAIISLSYIFKVLSGKRTLMLEFMDLFVGIFIFMIIFGGIITFGERGNVLYSVLFTGIYFIAASILRSEIWFKRSINAVLLTGFTVSVYAIIARFLGETLGFKLDITLETDVGDASASVISSFSVLSYFVLILGIFLLASLLICRQRGPRFGLILANISAVIFLFFTLPSGAWLAAVVAYITILILWKSRTALYMVLISLFLPFLPALKIYSVEHFFGNILNVLNRYDLWNAVIRMFTDFGLGGIGLGKDAFPSVYSAYFIGNTENAAHAGSLLVQILISLGIFGLIVFIAIIFFALQSSLSYGRSCSDKSGYNRIICYAGMCGIIASFIWGINEFIWYNQRVMLLFWLIMGVTVSARRSALDLTTDDKEANLYGDTYLE